MRTPRHLSSRLLPAAALAVASLALAGPAAAQTSPGPNAVYWNGTARGASPERPGVLVNDVAGEPPARLAQIQWTEWGGNVAQATANLYLYLPRSRQAVPVHVTLERKVNCAGWNVYTAWTLTLPPGRKQPPGFGPVRIRRAPCSPGPCPLLRMRCTHDGQDQSLAHYTRVPLGAGGRFFDLRWRSSGATATGRGIFRRSRRFGAPPGHTDPWIYPVKVQLSDLRWCGFRIVHSKMTLTAYGDGTHRDYDLSGRRRVRPPESVRRRLLRAIDRRGATRRADTYTTPGCEPSRAAPPPPPVP